MCGGLGYSIIRTDGLPLNGHLNVPPLDILATPTENVLRQDNFVSIINGIKLSAFSGIYSIEAYADCTLPW